MNKKENKSQKSLTAQDEVTEFLLYTVPGGDVKVEVILNNETIWLTQQRMADLFGIQRPAITKHLKNIYESGELNEETTSSILEHMGETGHACLWHPSKIVQGRCLSPVVFLFRQSGI